MHTVSHLRHVETCMNIIYWTAFIIISLTILRSQGFKSLCDSIQVYNGSSSKITCDFEDDIKKHQRNIYVEHVHADHNANPETVMSCRWRNGSFDCEGSIGYQFDSNWTSTSISVIIPETLPNHAGQYWCEVMSSDASHNTRCQLVVLPTGTYTDSMTSTVTAGSTSSENNASFKGCSQPFYCDLLSRVEPSMVNLISKGVTSFCKVVMNGPNATLTCCFDSDIGVLQSNLYVDHVSKHGLESVLSCRWKDGKRYCESLSGYNMNNNISDTVTVEILNVSNEHAGEYWCEVLPSPPVKHKSCRLNVPDIRESNYTTFQISNQENNRTDTSEDMFTNSEMNPGSVVGLVVGVLVSIIIISSVLLIRKIKCKKKANSLHENEQPSHLVPLNHDESNDRTTDV